MKKYFKIIFAVVFLIITQTAFSQTSTVKAGYSQKEKAIIVKWFAEKNRFDEGVVIYRKDNEKNTWEKLTDKPVKKPAKLSDSELKNVDSAAAIYNYMLYNVPTDKEEYENWEFTLLLQTLLNNDFAKYAGLCYSDTKIEPGKKYTYKVSYLKNGSETELEQSNEIGTDEVVPSLNNSLTLIQNIGKIYCNWNAEPEKFVSYNIYRDGKKLNDNPVFVFEADKKPAFLFSDSLSSEGTYNYSYTGLDGFGNESAPSQNVSITIVAVNLPPRPVNVRYDGNGKLTLYWSIQNQKGVTGFNIYRSEDAKGVFTKVNTSLLAVSDTMFIDNTAEMNKKYFYYVSSENAAGLTTASSIIAAVSNDYAKPEAPSNFSAVSDSVKVMLSWNASASTNVIGYKIYRNTKGNEAEFLLLTPLPVKETSYADTLTKGALNDFYYKIVSVNKVYINSDYSAPVSVKLKDVVPPAQPVIINSELNNNAVVITWLQQFESDLTGYKIFRSEDSVSGFTEMASLTKEILSFKDNNTAAGKNYYYKIAAVDAAGNTSMMSEYYNITIPENSFQTADLKFTSSYDKANNSINISWDAVSGNQVKGYIVMRRDGDEEFAYAVSEMLSTANFKETNIESPAKYSYSIKVIYENGDVVTTAEQTIETN
jgi:fibronectin type 3 domain-containing protein